MPTWGMCLVLGVLAAAPAAVDPPRVVDRRLAIDLVAAEPDIVTPTGIAVDAKGRVLAIESHTHFRPEGYVGPPADRIRVFEDADGDGRYERISTYFEGTKTTMGLARAADGSVFVVTRYEVLRLEDRDGDGRAEASVPLVRLDTPGNYPHNGLSGPAFDASGNLVFGLGENLGADYRLVGSDGTTLSGGGEGGSVYRCRPDGSELTRIATGFWNPFHQAFDAFGRLFVVDNDPDSRPPCRLLHVVDGGDYGYRFRNGRKGLHPFTAWNGELPGTLPMVAGTGEAPSGLVVYESDQLPDDYRGDVLATSWGDHRVERFRLRPQGASFRSTLEPIVEGGENFRPVGIVVAPDGSLFVSDWMDKSYPVHGKGRIWHIRAADRPRRGPREPAPAGRELSSPDLATRRAAARALAKSGDATGLQVLRLEVEQGGDPRARAVALETLLDRDGEPDVPLRVALLDRSSDVRALAVRRLPARLVDVERIARDDESPAVRAEALRRIADPRGLPQLMKGVEDTDPFVAEAAREGLKHALDVPRLVELAKTESAARRLGILLVLRDSADPAARAPLAAFLADADPTIRFAAIQWVAEQRLVEFRDRLRDGLASGASTRALFEAYLAALERLDGVSRPLDQEVKGEELVARLVIDESTPTIVRRRALRMLRPDHPVLTLNRLRHLLTSPDPGLRTEAVRTLRESPQPGRIAILESLARDRARPDELRAEAIVGIDGDANDRRELLVALAGDPKPAVRHEALRSLRGATLSEGQRVTLDALSPTDDETKALVARLVGRGDEPGRPDARNLDAWLALLQGSADPEEGGRIFFQPKGPGCSRCHQVDGRGGRTGPDLSTTAQVLTRSRLVESILQPSKEVAPQFVAWVVGKKDGTIVTGTLIDESPLGEQTYADANGRLLTFPASEVDERHAQAASIMPDDLARTLTVAEFRHLLAYLQKPRKDEPAASQVDRAAPQQGGP